MHVPVLVWRQLGCGVSATSNQNIKEVTHVEKDKGTLCEYNAKMGSKKVLTLSMNTSVHFYQ
jgi:hypothetical protein